MVLVIYYVIKNNFLKKKNTNKVIVQKLLQLILNIFKKVFFKKKNAKTLIFSSKHFQALAILFKCNERISVFEVLLIEVISLKPFLKEFTIPLNILK